MVVRSGPVATEREACFRDNLANCARAALPSLTPKLFTQKPFSLSLFLLLDLRELCIIHRPASSANTLSKVDMDGGGVVPKVNR